MIDRFDRKDFHLVFTHGVGCELSLNHTGEKSLNEEDTKDFLSITGAVMLLGRIPATTSSSLVTSLLGIVFDPKIHT